MTHPGPRLVVWLELTTRETLYAVDAKGGGKAAVKNNASGMMEAQSFTACIYAPKRRELKATGARSPHNTLFMKEVAVPQARLQSGPPMDIYGSFY